MTSPHFMLSDAASAFIREQMATGNFASPDEVINKALEEAREREASKRLAKLLREGLESGPPIRVTRELMQQRRAELLAKLPPNAAE